MSSQITAILQKLSSFRYSLGKIILSTYESTQILRFFVILHCENCYGSVKRPNTRACALETTASFLALPVPCVSGPTEDARPRGPGDEDGSSVEG